MEFAQDRLIVMYHSYFDFYTHRSGYIENYRDIFVLYPLCSWFTQSLWGEMSTYLLEWVRTSYYYYIIIFQHILTSIFIYTYNQIKEERITKKVVDKYYVQE